MKGNVFASLVSITNGLHRDNRSEREFDILNSELKETSKVNNAVFKVNFKRPLNSKKEYYFKLISNDTETELAAFIQNRQLSQNPYSKRNEAAALSYLAYKINKKAISPIKKYVNSKLLHWDNEVLKITLEGKLLSRNKQFVKIQAKSQLIDSVPFCKGDEFIICTLQQKNVQSKVGFTKAIKNYDLPK